jgi:hypothetical protein
VSPDPRSVVEAYLAAQSARDFDAMRDRLADTGFCYTSPIARIEHADAFIQYAMVSSGIILDRVVRKVFIDGDDVCHILTYRIQISDKECVDVAHWAQVRDGRIQRIEVLFDASLYRALFPTDGAL